MTSVTICHGKVEHEGLINEVTKLHLTNLPHCMLKSSKYFSEFELIIIIVSSVKYTLNDLGLLILLFGEPDRLIICWENQKT